MAETQSAGRTDLPLRAGDADWLGLSARNLAQFLAHVPHTMGQRTAEWDDVWAEDAGSAAPSLNSATLLRPLDDAAIGGLVQRLAAFYDAGAGGSWMLWSAWPTSDLTPHGFHLIGHPPLMILPGGAPLPDAPPELRIVEVGDAGSLHDFEDVLIAGYPVPEVATAPEPRMFDTRILGGPLHLFVGYANDGPVTVAVSYVDGPTVGVYAVATLPTARGRGYGGAITARAVRAAPALPAVLQSSDDGLPIYKRLGFRELASYGLWIRERGAGA